MRDILKNGKVLYEKEAQEWVKIADEDLQSGECPLERKPYRTTCYHAEQTGEKYRRQPREKKGVNFPELIISLTPA